MPNDTLSKSRHTRTSSARLYKHSSAFDDDKRTPHNTGMPQNKNAAAEGNVGERGEEWALAQVAILLFVAMGSVPLIGGLITLLTGPGLVAGGIGVSAAGLKGLGKSLSPWPAPIEDNELSTEGIYGMMRHPTYTGERGNGWGRLLGVR